MPSFFVPLSGLEANSNALSVTANNLANLSTTDTRPNAPCFQDLFYQQLGTSGDGNPEQVALERTFRRSIHSLRRGAFSRAVYRQM